MAAFLTLTDTTEPLRLEYDATHYVPFAVASDGSLTVTPTGTSGVVMPWKWGQTNGIVQQFPTSEAGHSFYITRLEQPNDPLALGRIDAVMRIGYNIAATGGAVAVGEHAVAIEWESYWYQAGQGNWTEFHAVYVPKDGANLRRLWSWLIDVDDDTSQMYFQAGAYEFRDFSVSPGNPMFAISSAKTSLYSPLLRGENNVEFLNGWTAAGLQAPVLKFNASDQVELGSTTYGTFIPKTLQVGFGTGETGANLGIYGRNIGALDSIIILNNATATAGSGTVIECGWGDTDSKLRFGMKNGNTFVVDTYAPSAWTNRLTLSSVGLLTITGGLTLAGAITQTVASANHLMTSSTGTNTAYTKYNNTGGDMYVGRNGSTASALLSGCAAYAGVISVEGAYPLQLGTNGAIRLQADANGNVVVGTAALATNAANGFFYIPSSAGAPTGTPTAFTGRVPLHYDSTNHKLYIYNGGWLATAALT